MGFANEELATCRFPYLPIYSRLLAFKYALRICSRHRRNLVGYFTEILHSKSEFAGQPNICLEQTQQIILGHHGYY